MIVYADILIFLNSIITYFLLLSVCAFFKTRPKTYRLILGALFGGISALAIFLPDLYFFGELLLRTAICVISVLITFSYKNKIRFIKYSLSFLTFTYIFGGAMMALFSIFHPKSMLIANGIAYFNISPIILILSTALIYIFIKILMLFTINTKPEGLIYDCIVEYKSLSAKFSAINDTGNSLCDPYFNFPVVIVQKDVLSSILTLSPKTYLIPVKSVAKKGLLYAFRPTAFYIVKNNKRIKIDNVTIALSENKIHKQFSGILPSKIINFTEEEICLSTK